MKNRTVEELIKSYNKMEEPGAWDYDSDINYTRNCNQYKILKELDELQVNYKFDEDGRIKI